MGEMILFPLPFYSSTTVWLLTHRLFKSCPSLHIPRHSFYRAPRLGSELKQAAMGSSIRISLLKLSGLLLAASNFSSALGSVFRQPVSPGYRPASDVCPRRCADAGADSANWQAFPGFDQLNHCLETMFYDFSLFDNVDDRTASHRIFACTSFGPDWTSLPNSTLHAAQANTADVEYEIGLLDESVSGLDASGIRSVSKQMRRYFESGFGEANETGVLFAQSGRASLGLYIGSGLQREGVSSVAFNALEAFVSSDMMASTVGMQLCNPAQDATHAFGLMATTNASFAPIQEAIKSWANATCLPFQDSEKIPGKAHLVTPLLEGTSKNSTATRSSKRSEPRRLTARDECETIRVNPGNGCSALAERCGISGHTFKEYNDYKDDLCSTLQAQQPVCCTKGDLPDFSPDPQQDGTCATHKVTSVDTCSSLAAANSLTVKDLKEFNKNTWGWTDCEPLQRGAVICLSKGDPPMPAQIEGTACGPQVPGTEKPSDGESLSGLNPCPLNACCSGWGFCGTTAEFCTDTNTGAPGTAEPGTNGCISNCGMDIVRGDAPATFRKIGYFQGYNLNRKCIHQDATQIDASAYTHLQFAFGMITPDYQINAGDEMSTYQFGVWKNIAGPKKILSFGGWAFSTEPATYNIFREGTKKANRQVLAKNIADYINEHELDGVDIDWEYPGVRKG